MTNVNQHSLVELPHYVKLAESEQVALHKESMANRVALDECNWCGCFYCLKMFSPDEIGEWITDGSGDTAICPKCGIDSVVAESVHPQFGIKLLEDMKSHWF